MKVCKTCKVEKLPDCYNVDKRNGRSFVTCKECCKRKAAGKSKDEYVRSASEDLFDMVSRSLNDD